MYYPIDEMILGAAILILIFFIIAYVVLRINPFLEERRYIKAEISRTTDEEQLYWKEELKWLYIFSIPVFGPILKFILFLFDPEK